MSHARKQIRDAAVVLVTDSTTTKTNVFGDQEYSLSDSEIPGLVISTGNEEIDSEQGRTEKIQFRTVDLIIEGHGMTTGNITDQLDLIASEVETAMLADETMGGLVYSIDLSETNIETDAETEELTGVVEMLFRVQYLTMKGAPDVII